MGSSVEVLEMLYYSAFYFIMGSGCYSLIKVIPKTVYKSSEWTVIRSMVLYQFLLFYGIGGLHWRIASIGLVGFGVHCFYTRIIYICCSEEKKMLLYVKLLSMASFCAIGDAILVTYLLFNPFDTDVFREEITATIFTLFCLSPLLHVSNAIKEKSTHSMSIFTLVCCFYAALVTFIYHNFQEGGKSIYLQMTTLLGIFGSAAALVAFCIIYKVYAIRVNNSTDESVFWHMIAA